MVWKSRQKNMLCNAVKLTTLYPKADSKVCLQCKSIHHFIPIDQREQVTAIQVRGSNPGEFQIGGSNLVQSEQSRSVSVQWEQVTAIQVMQSLHLLLVLGSLVLFPAPSKSMAAHDQDRRPPGQFVNHLLAKREARQCPTGCCKSCVRSHVDCYIYTRHVEKKPWGPCGIGKFCSWIHDTFCNDTDNVYP